MKKWSNHYVFKLSDYIVIMTQRSKVKDQRMYRSKLRKDLDRKKGSRYVGWFAYYVLILRSGKRSRHMAGVDIGRHFALAVSQLDPNRKFITVYTWSCIKQITFCLMLDVKIGHE